MKDKNGYLKRKESTNHHLHFTSLYFFFLPEECSLPGHVDRKHDLKISIHPFQINE